MTHADISQNIIDGIIFVIYYVKPQSAQICIKAHKALLIQRL